MTPATPEDAGELIVLRRGVRHGPGLFAGR